MKTPISPTTKVFAVIGIVVVLYFVRLSWDYFNPTSPANLAMQVQLKLFGAAIYEYHSQTGRWPSSVDDLARTSLPERSHVWRQTAKAIMLLWPQDLKPNPRDNSKVLLAYWKVGLNNNLGSVWACWGDLRTARLNVSALPRPIAAPGMDGPRPQALVLENSRNNPRRSTSIRCQWVSAASRGRKASPYDAPQGKIRPFSAHRSRRYPLPRSPRSPSTWKRRDEPLEKPPHQARVDFQMLQYSPADPSELRRTLHTANFVFRFWIRVPNDLIRVNSLGLTITYFREDEASN